MVWNIFFRFPRDISFWALTYLGKMIPDPSLRWRRRHPISRKNRPTSWRPFFHFVSFFRFSNDTDFLVDNQFIRIKTSAASPYYLHLRMSFHQGILALNSFMRTIWLNRDAMSPKQEEDTHQEDPLSVATRKKNLTNESGSIHLRAFHICRSS